jgi:N-methylhydantoinase B
MLEQTEYIPVLAFALEPVCKKIVEYFGDNIHPGDVILHNDVFTGGNQNADVATFKPVFYRDKLFAWTAVKGHQADIGGGVAGGYNPMAGGPSHHPGQDFREGQSAARCVGSYLCQYTLSHC